LIASAETPGTSGRRGAVLDFVTGRGATTTPFGVGLLPLGGAGVNVRVADGSVTFENSGVALRDFGVLAMVVTGCDTLLAGSEGAAASGAVRETALNTGNDSATTFDEAHTDRLKNNTRKIDNPLRWANRS